MFEILEPLLVTPSERQLRLKFATDREISALAIEGVCREAGWRWGQSGARGLWIEAGSPCLRPIV